MNITIINGSLGGRTGNTNNLMQKVRRIILKKDPGTKVRIIHLSPTFDWIKVRRAIKASDALIFCTGTYWDSWGSPMQLLFEKTTLTHAATSEVALRWRVPIILVIEIALSPPLL